MKIILTATISGTRNGDAWPPAGSEVDLPDGEAVDMLNAGLALTAGGGVETAIDSRPVEKAVRTRRKA